MLSWTSRPFLRSGCQLPPGIPSAQKLALEERDAGGERRPLDSRGAHAPAPARVGGTRGRAPRRSPARPGPPSAPRDARGRSRGRSAAPSPGSSRTAPRPGARPARGRPAPRPGRCAGSTGGSLPAEPPARCFSSETRSGRDALKAGASPNTIAVSTDIERREEEHAQAGVRSTASAGSAGGRTAHSAPWAQYAIRRPRPPASDRQQQPLGQELADQPAARRAQRQPHRHLALPRGRAGQQQVGHVRAGDQQHQPDDRHQQPAHAHQVLAEAGVDRGLREREEHDAAPAVVVRVLARELVRDGLQVGLGLLDASRPA